MTRPGAGRSSQDPRSTVAATNNTADALVVGATTIT